MDGLFMNACKVCVAFSDSAKRMEAQGRRHRGDTLTVTEVTTISFVNPVKEIRVGATQNAVPVLNKAGGQIGTSTADSGSFVLTMTFENRHWIVQRLQAVQE
jgi:hypothetical protein